MQNNEKRQQPMLRVREIVFMGIMIALDVLAVRFLSFEIPTMRIGTGFLAIIIAGMYLGPLRAGLVGLIADLLGFVLFGKGIFFPGFTISALVNGVIAGYFLEGKKSAKVVNYVLYALISTLVVDTLMNTTWLVMMLHENDFSYFMARLLPRLPNQVVVTVLKIIMVPILYRTLFQRFVARGVEHPGIRERGERTVN